MFSYHRKEDILFKVLQELKLNSKLIVVIKNYIYKTKNGKVKHLLHTNLQFIEPTEFVITFPITLTILEYKINEISGKPFYIKEYHQKYNLKELIIKKVKFKGCKIDSL